GVAMSSSEKPDAVAAAREIEELRAEVATLRRRLGEPSDQVRDLEARLESLTVRNGKLLETLKDARQQLITLREEVDRLAQPPSGYGVLLETFDDQTVDVFTSGRKMRVAVSPNLELDTFRPGQTVRLNEALTVVEVGGFERVGEITTLREVLDDGTRALVVGHADEERIVWLAAPLAAAAADNRTDVLVDDENSFTLRPGDSLLVDSKAGYAFERIPKAEVEDQIG